MKYLYYYLLLADLVALVMMAVDKRRAIRHRWRIAERVLVIIALVGGSGGILLGMLLFWHKVRDKAFTIGMPVIFAVQLAIVLVIRYFAA